MWKVVVVVIIDVVTEVRLLFLYYITHFDSHIHSLHLQTTKSPALMGYFHIL